MAGKSVNKVILVGNLGKDPEIKYTPGGMPVAKFSLATNERFKDKEGNWQDRTEWHNIVAFQRTAEIVGSISKKAANATSRVACELVPGMTRKLGKKSIRPKSSPMTSFFSAGAAKAAASSAAAHAVLRLRRVAVMASTSGCPSTSQRARVLVR